MAIRQTAQERLKDKLYKIDISEDVSKTQSRHFDSKEFIRKAREVRKTFKDENILSANATF